MALCGLVFDFLRARFHWSLPMDAKSLSLTCASRESISPRALARIADGRSWFLCGLITAAALIATLMEVKSGRPTSIVTEKDMLISGQSLSRKFSPRTVKTTSGFKDFMDYCNIVPPLIVQQSLY